MPQHPNPPHRSAASILRASARDSIVLTDITRKSKAHWEYGDEQMELWADELTVPEEYIDEFETYKVVVEGEIVGYYSFIHTDPDTILLDNMFVLPAYIGKGYGRTMMEHFLLRVEELGMHKIILDADPHAEKFYQRFGFEVIEKYESSVKGRYIPVMVLVRT